MLVSRCGRFSLENCCIYPLPWPSCEITYRGRRAAVERQSGDWYEGGMHGSRVENLFVMPVTVWLTGETDLYPSDSFPEKIILAKKCIEVVFGRRS